jgi:hypothetical protein
MVNPVPGFSITTPYRKVGSWWRACGWHTGVDLAAPSGTAIVAPIPGTIRHRNYGAAFGPYQFVISPDPGSTGDPLMDNGEVFFAHNLDRLPDGTQVRAGQRISRVGSLGNSSGPHLHMELHAAKGQWNCGTMRNPQRAIDWQPAGSAPPSDQWKYPSGTKVYAKYLKWKGHEQNSDGKSTSIGAWQDMLNHHSLSGGVTLPVTEAWHSMTAAETQKCQTQHVPPADTPLEQVFVGPKQFDHVKSDVGAPYVWIADTSTEPPPPPGWDGSWHNSQSLMKLRREVDAMWPNRDKSSDGTIGDAAHSKSKSEHNPVGHPYGPEYGTKGAVHAIDITAKDIDADLVVSQLIGDRRAWYVIYNGKIYSKTYGWVERDYTGSNPHSTHLHLSLAADDQNSAVFNELDESAWGVLSVPPDPEPEPPAPAPEGYMTRAEFEAWRQGVAEALMREL